MRIEKQTGFHRILVYGVPKSGKTKLVSALPWGLWGDCVYVAADQGAEGLAGVHADDTSHIRIEKPAPAVGKTYDPLREAAALASTDWSKEQGVGVLVWDTLTQTAQDLLHHYAALSRFGSNIAFGEKGQPSYHAHPTMGDYGAVQSTVEHLLGFLFQQKLHVIVVCHADWAMPRSGEAGGLIGGPSTVGSATIKDLGRSFSAMIHLEPTRLQGGAIQYKAWTHGHGIWQAGVRSNVDLPDQVLSVHPTEFWKQLDAAVKG